MIGDPMNGPDGPAGRRTVIPRGWLVGGRLVVTVVAVVGAALALVMGGGGFNQAGDSPGGVALEALEEAGVLDGTGCGDGRSRCTGEPLRRWAMAVWVVRALGLTPEAAPAGRRFADVDPDVWWGPHVEMLADMRIVRGCGTNPGGFCPQDTVTRAQMAGVLAPAFGLPAAPAVRFADIEGNIHASGINALAAAGAGMGCGNDPTRFCPDRVVTRGQAAAVLHPLMVKHGERADRGWVSSDVPGVALVDPTVGEAVNLRTLVGGARPLLLWFWSPL